MPLTAPTDDKLRRLTPRPVQPVTAADIGSIMAGTPPAAGAFATTTTAPPSFSIPRIDTSTRQAPQFDSKANRQAQIMALLGLAGGVLAGPDRPALSALASGVTNAAGLARDQIDENYATGLEGYQQFLSEAGDFNRKAALKEAEVRYETSRDDFEYGRERTDTLADAETKHQRELEEIQQREAADLAAQKELKEFINGLPITEKDKQQLEINLMNARANQGRVGIAAQREQRLRETGGRKATISEGEAQSALRAIDNEADALSTKLSDLLRLRNQGNALPEDEEELTKVQQKLFDLATEREKVLRQSGGSMSQQATSQARGEIGDITMEEAQAAGLTDEEMQALGLK